jgi:inhibitor of cysteine peptidase
MADVQLTKTDDGRTIEVKVGDLVIIELEENPSTGFRWVEASEARPIASLRASHSIPATVDPRTAEEHHVGAGGVRRFEYSIEQGGTGPLKLHERQEWGERPTADTFSLTIVARD